MYLKFYLENQRMPDAAEMNDICKSLFVAVKAIAPKTEYEEFYRIVEKRETGHETRILKRHSEWNYTRNTYGKRT